MSKRNYAAKKLASIGRKSKRKKKLDWKEKNTKNKNSFRENRTLRSGKRKKLQN